MQMKAQGPFLDRESPHETQCRIKDDIGVISTEVKDNVGNRGHPIHF